MTSPAELPPVTILIEWENAIDVEDEWTEKSMAALLREIKSVAGRMAEKPRINYLYDDTAVEPEAITRVIAKVAPQLEELADLEIVPTPGLSYYELKNFGVARATTAISIMLDSDTSPQPGWLENLLKPFADPEIMAVGGFTVLGYEDLLSRTMALSWIFNLADEREKTERRRQIHVNNCAVRTDFFHNNPFPDLPLFKKHCGFWVRDLTARGIRFVRTADAVTVHAPHPGYKYVAYRAWMTGSDLDYQGYQTISPSRIRRLQFALTYFTKKVARSWARVLSKGHKVDLPLWQRPAAMVVGFGFYFIVLISQLKAIATRSYAALPIASGAVQPELQASV
ncbi:MAG: glycosyltransferase [Pseudomonadota bacterium]|nr:glycosyltransferase [Pseudomonadota bacterium]